MVTIYPTGNDNYATGGYIYTGGVLTTTSANTIVPYENNYGYGLTASTPITAKTLNAIESSFGKKETVYTSDVIAEALFTLKPKLKKKYKGDKAKFLEDLMWAAQHRKEEDAVEKISAFIGDGEDF